jgi:hypothetical protein
MSWSFFNPLSGFCQIILIKKDTFLRLINQIKSYLDLRVWVKSEEMLYKRVIYLEILSKGLKISQHYTKFNKYHGLDPTFSVIKK